jgi:murein DD-endopeptidase MepM/ murein hydrolase activator NlpD
MPASSSTQRPDVCRLKLPEPLALERALRHLTRVAAGHHKSIAAAVSIGLAGFAVTAFGIAPMAPDAAELPKRTVTETIALPDLEAQVEQLADHAYDVFRSDLTRASDTADSLLARLGVSDPEAAAFLRRDPAARKLLEGRGGKMVQVRTDAAGRLAELTARFAAPSPKSVPAGSSSGSDTGDKVPTHFTRLKIERAGRHLFAYSTVAALASQTLMASGTVRSSFFGATDDARIPDPVAIQMAEIFANDIDFRNELRKGSTFSVVYESLTADGEAITWGSNVGRVLAAEFVNGGQTHSAVWFKGDGGKGAYYALDGTSKKRAFLASPLEFSRVTSGFAMRIHPIFNTWKQHNGVDYAAPAGTPVRAVGDATVDFAGWQNGYGNVVVLKHGNDRLTTYAHLSAFHVAKGERVEQGDTIGTVGSTGFATGPHLHFEVKIAGQLADPLQLAQSADAAVSLTAAAKAQLGKTTDGARSQLAVAGTLARASYAGE